MRCCFIFAGILQCDRDEYKCVYDIYPDECIPRRLLCDQRNDCIDGQDEFNCGTEASSVAERYQA